MLTGTSGGVVRVFVGVVVGVVVGVIVVVGGEGQRRFTAQLRHVGDVADVPLQLLDAVAQATQLSLLHLLTLLLLAGQRCCGHGGWHRRLRGRGSGRRWRRDFGPRTSGSGDGSTAVTTGHAVTALFRRRCTNGRSGSDDSDGLAPRQVGALTVAAATTGAGGAAVVASRLVVRCPLWLRLLLQLLLLLLLLLLLVRLCGLCLHPGTLCALTLVTLVALLTASSTLLIVVVVAVTRSSLGAVVATGTRVVTMTVVLVASVLSVALVLSSRRVVLHALQQRSLLPQR